MHISKIQLAELIEYVRSRAIAARRSGTSRAIVDELIVLLLSNAGLRAGELCALNLADIPGNNPNSSLTVRDAAGRITRTVEILPALTSALRRFVELHRKDARPDEPLLLNERGGRMIYMSIYSKVRNIGRKAGIRKLNPNMLRHAYITGLFDAGKDFRSVQQQAGHANPKTTARYLSANPSLGQAASDEPKTVAPSGAPAVDKDTVSKSPPSPTDELTQQDVTCDACEKVIMPGSATRIESGHILCAECIREIRAR